MKMVVGSAFWGLGNNELEDEIIRDVAQASQSYVDKPMKSPAYNAREKGLVRGKILKKLKSLLQWRLQYYLHALVNKLCDPAVQLG
jgi:hypothetical protein